ncbi:MAG: FG-GAP repeat protein [Planctomycetes bacterium]|nr:FG-GAP repeat protein [Planctomycetota bacterium]
MSISPHTLSSAVFALACLAATIGAQQPNGGRIDPFVEFTVTTSEGGTIPTVISAGDLNGDGYDEILIGRVVESFGGFERTGTVELISGIDYSSLMKWGGNIEDSEFGEAICMVSDSDGDGIDDIAIGAPSEALGAGAVYLFSGAPPYTPLKYWGGIDNDDNFGCSIADAGDRNGDGTPDLLIGASGFDYFSLGLYDSGKAYLFSGNDPQATGLIREWEGVSDGGNLGASVLVMDDMSGDGVQDFVLGQPGIGPFGQSEGAVLVVSGADGSPLMEMDSDDGTEGFGSALASPGDFDNDGWPDILVGAPKMDPLAQGHEIGFVILYSGATGEELFFWKGEEKFSWFGFSIDTADIDGDGADEILVGSPLYTGDGPTNWGAFYAYSGTTGELILRQTGTQESHILGAFCRFGGDVNNDGVTEIIAPYWDNPFSVNRTGKVAIYSSEIIPQMTSSSTTLSVSAGGTIEFDLDFTSDASFYYYKLLFSSAGMGPVNILGLSVPLSYDVNLVNSYLGIYPPFFSNPTGLLNPSGQSTVKLIVPPNAIPTALIGSTYYFASICNLAWRTPELSSVAVPLTFEQ